VSLRSTTVVLLLAALPTPQMRAQAPFVPFVVAVWSANALLPFADFDGTRWRSSWPQPVDISSGGPGILPIIPPLAKIPSRWWGRSTFQPAWELLEPDGRRRTVQIRGTLMGSVGTSCSATVGLRTNLPVDAYERHALAVSRPGVLEPIASATATHADWRTVSALLPDIYKRYDVPKDVARPDLPEPGARVTLEELFSSTDASGHYVYFSSWRARMDRIWDSEITGWLWRRSSESPFQIIGVEARTRDDNEIIPLAVVNDGARRFWLVVASGKASSSMAVLDVRRGGVKEVLRVDYGGC